MHLRSPPIPNHWMKTIWLLLGIWLSSAFALTADPANFMLHNFTFDRPAGWQWIDTKDDRPRIELHNTSIPGELAVATFSLYPVEDDRSTIDGSINFWARNFNESVSKLKVKKESVQIGNRHLTYFSFTGTFHYFSRSLKKELHVPRYTVVGTVIEEKNENIVIVLRGHGKAVAAQTPTFKGMIANALAEN